MNVRRTVRRAGSIALAIGLMAVLAGCGEDPPTTVGVDVTSDCQIKSNNTFVPNGNTTLAAHYDTTAPQAVAPAGTLVVTIAPAPFSFDGNPTSNGTVTQLSNLVWRVAVPANASLTSQSIANWANVGAGTPTSMVSGSTIVVTIPGPVLPSTTANPNTITLPTLTMNLTATGAAGSRINAKISGTSYSSPGMSFDATVTGTLVGTLHPSFSCFPSPSPTLHTTLISTDTKAPVITITAPTAGQSVVQGSTVLAAFSCDDGTGVGVATCAGTVANGAPINTSTLGAKSFTVTSTDNEGKASSKTVSYTVVAPA